MKRTSVAWLWLLLPLLLVTTWLGARGLNADPFWLDEVWSVYNAGGAHYGPISPSDLWTRNAVENPRNAVGYHLLLAGWGALVGWTPFASRASSLLCGVLAVAWTYRLGRDLVSPLTGVAASVVLGTSALYVYYLHELRAYVPSVLLVALTVWIYWRIIQTAHNPSLPLQTGFVLALAGLLYVYYYNAIVIGAIALYHLFFVRKERLWWRIAVLMAIAGLLFLPWLSAMLAGLELAANDAILQSRSMTADQILGSLAYYFGDGVVWLPVAALILALLARERGVASAWFFAVVSLLLLLFANLRLPVIAPGRERYLLMLWPLLAVVAGMGIMRMTHIQLKRLPAMAFIGLWAFIGIQASLSPEFTQDIDGSNPLPWDAIAQVLAVEAQPDEPVIVHVPVGNWVLEITTAEHYLHGLPLRFTLLEALPGGTIEELRQSEREFVAGAARVWLGVDRRAPPASVLADLQQTLSKDFVSCGAVLDLPRMSLTLYIRKPSDMGSDTAVIRFGDGVSLAYYSPLPTQVGDALEMTLIWAVNPDVPPYTYSVALHVLDSNGQLVAQHDYGLPNEPLACRQSAIPLDTLPPGEYTLTTTVYRWENGERLTGAVVTSGEQGDRLPLGTFTIGG